MSASSSSGNKPAMSNYADNLKIESKKRILTQEEVHEQIRSYIAPLTKQLEDLTRLIPRMSAAQRPNLYPRPARVEIMADYFPV